MSDTNPRHSDNEYPIENWTLFSLLSRKKELVIEVFAARGINIPKSISKPALLDRVKKLLRAGILEAKDIAALQERLQGWGKQQIYLYSDTLDESCRRRWLDEFWVRSRFEQANMTDLLNDGRPVDISDKPTLFEASYSESDGKIRFKWAEFVGGLDRRQSRDIKKEYEVSEDGTALERMVYHAYLETYATDISSFEWDIQSGNAAFMIRKVSDRFYMGIRDDMSAELADIISIKQDFRPIALRELLKNLDLIENINRRRLKYRTTHDKGTITLASGNQRDIFDDSILQKAHESFVRDADRLGGFINWPLAKQKDIGLYIYTRKKEDQRIGIDAQALEKDIRSVLQDIRRYST